MRYIFFGTPLFAAIILEKLIGAGLRPEAVVTNPDRPFGRKKIVTPPPVKLVAQKHDILILQPERLSNIEISKFQNIEIFVVAAYGRIIPKEILAVPRLGAIGVHPSLLPKYRGPTPIQSVVLAGEKETGVTLYLMDEKTDHGPILATSVLPLATRDTYEKLVSKLADFAGTLIVETLPKFLKGEISPQAQDESQATYTKKFTTQEAFVNLEKDDPVVIDRKIRALNPEPGTWTMQNGKRVKLLEAELADGKLRLKKIQREGKKPTVLANDKFLIPNF